MAELIAIRNAVREEYPRLNLGAIDRILKGDDKDYTEDEIFAVQFYKESLW